MLSKLNPVGILGIIVGIIFLLNNIKHVEPGLANLFFASIWPTVVIILAIASFFLNQKWTK